MSESGWLWYGEVKGLDGVRVSGCGTGRDAFEYPHSLPLHPSRSDCLWCVPQALGRVVEVFEVEEEVDGGGRPAT